MSIAAVRSPLRFRRKHANLAAGALVALAILPAHLHAAPRPIGLPRRVVKRDCKPAHARAARARQPATARPTRDNPASRPHSPRRPDAEKPLALHHQPHTCHKRQPTLTTKEQS